MVRRVLTGRYQPMTRLFGRRGAVLPTSIVLAVLLGLWAYTPGRARTTEWFVAPGASGNGTEDAAFGRIQDALNVAEAGDIITVQPGTYRESLHTVRGGSPEGTISLRATG